MCYQVIGIIISAFIPVLIMFITLRSEKKRHLEQIKEIQEKNRIDALPILVISNIREHGYDIKNNMVTTVEVYVSLKNAGNGTAINVQINNNTIADAVAPGEETRGVTMTLNREIDEKAFSIPLLYSDVYKNKYKEEAFLDYSHLNNYLESKILGITCPELLL